MSEQWFHPRGSLGDGAWLDVVDGRLPGWEHTGLRIGSFSDAAEFPLPAADVERMVLPLAGSLRIDWRRGGERGTVEPAGRGSVFDGPADVVYVGAGTEARVTGEGRFAVAEAPLGDAAEPLPVTVVRASDVPVEIRGAGRLTRQVHNFGVPGVLAARKLIVCEVITPAGNWSSYPAHKHDELVPGVESRLEEIYYFEAAAARGLTVPGGAPGVDPFGLFASYGSPGHDIEINAMVRTGDIALVPYGYHGPAAAAPGYDLYYLNVMAGPDPERVWSITDDPVHAWLRGTWAGQEPDPRLPYGPPGPRTDDAGNGTGSTEVRR